MSVDLSAFLGRETRCSTTEASSAVILVCSRETTVQRTDEQQLVAEHTLSRAMTLNGQVRGKGIARSQRNKRGETTRGGTGRARSGVVGKPQGGKKGNTEDAG